MIPRSNPECGLGSLDTRGLNLIDAGHFPTENPVCTVLANTLRSAFPELEICLSQTHRDIVQFA